jgi:8-oxo-dGTP pyrophosphatase MutT (NUDIX family)
VRAAKLVAEPDRVVRIESLALEVSPGRWLYADHHRDVIDAHWKLATAANPSFFNGVIHVIDRIDVGDTLLTAQLLATDFKSYLYWRDEGYPTEGGVRDGFGSALIRTGEGHILLGRQRLGNINAGLAYLPGGFIDSRDAGAGGVVDIAASIERELREETGLGMNDLEAEPGYIVTMTGAQVSFAVAYNSPLGSKELVAKVHTHIAAEAEPELAEMVIVRGVDDLRGLAMPHYARVLLNSPLAWSR